jgi:hypothetical protein
LRDETTGERNNRHRRESRQIPIDHDEFVPESVWKTMQPFISRTQSQGCKNASSDLAMGLQAEVFLAKGARVMITSNICVERGVHNGSLGTVHSILLDPSKPLGGLPLAVIVKLDKFEGKSIFPDEPNCAPIVPKLASWNDGTGRFFTRKQVPLTLKDKH